MMRPHPSSNAPLHRFPVSFRIAAPSILALLMLIGCAGNGQRGGGDDAHMQGDAVDAASVAALRKRAQTLWDARVAKDWHTAFQFVEPAVQERVSEEQFITWNQESEPLVYEQYRFGEIQSTDDMGWVQVFCSVAMRKLPDLLARETVQWEKWRRTEGKWFPVPREEMVGYPAPPALRNLAEEKRLAERFWETWNARKNNQPEVLYEFIDPADRERITLEQIEESENLIIYVDCWVEWFEVRGTRGVVQVTYTRRINDENLSKLPSEELLMHERWTLVDGTWYLDVSPGST